MPPDTSSKPQIIVVALGIDPRYGSEPGKGWWWSCALSHHFQLHVITQPASQVICEHEPLVREAGWKFHPTSQTITTWAFPTGYRQYVRWLQEALTISAKITRESPIVGLCHVALGSFRVLPRYETLGIPYVIGPLGGGECAPMSYLWPRPVPLFHKLSETLRPVFNQSFALLPWLRSSLKSASMVLVTSEESEQVIRRMGGCKTRVVFPDAYDRPIPPQVVEANRSMQVPELREEVHLLWQGRPLWWKGPDLGLLIVQQALTAGIRLRLTMVSSWEGSFGIRIRALIQRLGIAAHVHLVAPLPRKDFLALVGKHHGFVASSLHDSGGIPLLEAQALGLPCLTPGFGGNREAACPEAGVARAAPRLNGFLGDTVQCLCRWQDDPAIWLQESKAAVHFAGQFTNQRLQDHVRDFMVPAFLKKVTPEAADSSHSNR